MINTPTEEYHIMPSAAMTMKKAKEEGKAKATLAGKISTVKPPVGLRPRAVFEIERDTAQSARLVEILEAMIRVAKANYSIPYAWSEEFDDKLEMHNDRPDIKGYDC